MVLLSPSAHARISTPWGRDDNDREALRRELLVTLDRVVEGQPLTLLFGVLSSREGIVQLKLMKPRPGVRIVGGFLAEDVFVGLFVFLREELPFKRIRAQTVAASKDYGVVNEDVRRAFNGFGLWPLHKPQALFQRRSGS